MMKDEMVIRSTSDGPAAGAFKLNANYMSGGNVCTSLNEDGLAIPAGLYLIQHTHYTPYSMNPTDEVVDQQLFDRLIENIEVFPTSRNLSKKKSHTSAKSTRKKRS